MFKKVYYFRYNLSKSINWNQDFLRFIPFCSKYINVKKGLLQGAETVWIRNRKTST